MKTIPDTDKNNYSFKTTSDGSLTLYSLEFGESMHTESGAYEEAVVKYVANSGILDSSKRKINALDIGFGLGYNITALLCECEKNTNIEKLSVVSLEKDKSFRDFLERITFNDSRDKVYSDVKKAFDEGFMKNEKYEIKVIFGDARQNIKALSSQFDIIFQDPYSPGKNPELWSLDYFRCLLPLLKKDGVLLTYSSAPQVRRALMDSHFIIGKARSTGKKKEGTIAKAAHFDEELSSKEIDSIYNEIKSTPYRDPELIFDRRIILENRILEMRKLKEIVKLRKD